MTRHVLIRSESGDHLVAESALPAEANLHDALADKPQLIPAADLGLGRVVVMGRESHLASGKADLILVDEMGQVCLVEVKKEGNPDTRQVVAQLLDYAASLWGHTLETFTEKVLRPYLLERGDDPSVGLEDFVTAAFKTGDEADENDAVSTELVTTNLAATLKAGTFVLVVAAPQIPPGVERALEYLNAQGLRVYALEVGYFRGQVECFVPRVSVSPPATTRSKSSTGAPVAPVERESFLESLGESVGPVVAETLDAVEEVGGRISWISFGAKVKVALGKTRQMGSFEDRRMRVTIKPPTGFPVDPFDGAQLRLAELGVGKPGSDAHSHRVEYDEATPDQLRQVCDVLVELCRELTSRVEWTELSLPHDETFTRNDNNVWLSRTPGLTDFQSNYLRARIMRLPGGAEVSVELIPLANAAPGWRPQFPDEDARKQVWPADKNSGSYRLVVNAVGRMR